MEKNNMVSISAGNIKMGEIKNVRLEAAIT